MTLGARCTVQAILRGADEIDLAGIGLLSRNDVECVIRASVPEPDLPAVDDTPARIREED